MGFPHSPSSQIYTKSFPFLFLFDFSPFSPLSDLAGLRLLHPDYLVAVEEAEGVQGLFDLFRASGELA